MKHRQVLLGKDRFEELVRLHHAAVYRSALRIVRDSATAQDVTQQVYLAVLEGRIALAGDGDERVLRWFAVKTALAELRATRQRRAREEKTAMSSVHSANEPESNDEKTSLWRHVAALPQEQEIALRLRFEEGLTFAAMG